MHHLTQIRRWSFSLLLIIIPLQWGCARFQLPSIDPTGNSIFLPAPNSTQILTPGTTTGNCLGLNPLRNRPATQVGNIFQPAPFTAPVPTPIIPQYPVEPAFQHPADPPPCNGVAADNHHLGKHHQAKHVIPKPTGHKTPGQNGQIIMTPSRIVAPVGSEVVVLAGICGGDGYFVKNQPLEWMLSNDSVGQIVQVGGMNHSTFNSLVPPSSRKFDGQYAWGRTGLKNLLLSRGTPTPADDIELVEGQTYISVSSASPGTTYVTGVAPKAEGWDRRRSSTIIHWVDGQWSIPAPVSATAGTVYPLTTVVSRASDGGGVEDWIVRYAIVGGAPAEFAPTGSQTAETKTDKSGNATAQIRQIAGQFEPGTTQVRVDVVRPPVFGEPELVVESGITSVTWSAPALTIRAIGPRTAGLDQPFNYRIEVTNPGDQISRDVVVRTKNLDDAIEFISSTPKPTEYGRQYEWKLGDIAPGSSPSVIDMQLKSKKRGNVGMCFEVASDTDRLRTEACAETEITAPCIGLTIEGPTTARVGDDALFYLNVQNQCDEPLEDIQITIRHDQNLLRPGESNPATYRLPVLQFGETRPLPITFNVQASGTHCFDVEIIAKGGYPPLRDRRCLEVGQGTPGQSGSQIGMEVRGGNPLEVGGQTLVEIRVTNNGSTPLENAVLTNRYSNSLEPVGISEGFREPNRISKDEIAIFLGNIQPGQTVNLELSYLGNIVDENAKAEFTVTTPSGASATDQIGVRVAATGTLQNAPDFGGRPEGPIGIPADPVQDQGDLSVRVQALERNIQMQNSLQADPNTPKSARIKFIVKNNRRTSLRDVDITLLVPPGIKLTSFDPGTTNLELEWRSDDFTQFYVRRCLELRPNEELEFSALVEGTRTGLATFEVQAESIDIVGTSVGRDNVSVVQ